MAVYPPIYGASVCSGIGGLDLAVSILLPDYRCLLYCEREVTAVEILVTRMEEGSIPPALIWDDLATLPSRQFRGSVSILTAGLPCQPFSVAGKQRGDKDERYIWPAFFRIVSEMQPAVVVLENVPGFTKWFRPIGEELCGLGYEFEAGLFSAGEVGASHKRLRFFALCWRPSDPRASGLIRALADPRARLDDVAVPRGIRSGSWGSEREGFGGWPASEQSVGNLADANNQSSNLYRGERAGLRLPSGAGAEVGYAEGNHELGDTARYDGQADGRSVAAGRSGGIVADAAWHERPGPHGQAGPGRGVCEAGDELADAEHAGSPPAGSASGLPTATDEPFGCDPDLADTDQRRRGEWPDATEPEPAGWSGARVDQGGGGAVADAGDGQLSQPGRGAEGRDGSRSAVEILGNPAHDHGWRGDSRAETGVGQNGIGRGRPAGAVIDLGHADDAGLEGWRESGYQTGAGRQRAGEPAGAELADAAGPGPEARRSDGVRVIEESRQGSAACSGRETDSDLPLFAPGPGATEAWQDLLVRRPELRPAISQAEAESLLCRDASGTADELDFEDRTDRLRSLGNMVQPLQAAFALHVLAKRAGLLKAESQ